MSRRWNPATRAAACVVMALVAAACANGETTIAPSPSTPAVSLNRPASPAKLSITSPRNGQVVHGTSIPLNVVLTGAKIVSSTTTDIVPDEGHLHVILDDRLVSMTGDTRQLLSDLTPGGHLLKVEFVASDHAPFDPRVIAVVSFEVKP